jgi:hypothetical protein
MPASCGKAIPSSETLTPYVAANSDVNAGSWSMIGIEDPRAVGVSPHHDAVLGILRKKGLRRKDGEPEEQELGQARGFQV